MQPQEAGDRLDVVGHRRGQPHTAAERLEAASQPAGVGVLDITARELVAHGEDHGASAVGGHGLREGSLLVVSTPVVFREDALSPGSEALWLAAVEHLARRFKAIRPLATDELSHDRAIAGRELDEWAGSEVKNWRSELERFYGDHAGVQLRRDPAVGERLRQLRGSGTKLAVYGVGPREASGAVLSWLGLDRRLDAVVLEPEGDPLIAACSALGANPEDVRHVETRAQVDEL